MSGIEIYGYSISFLITIIVAITTKVRNSKIDWGTTFSWFLIGILVTSHFNQKEILEKNTEIFSFYSDFRESPNIIKTARQSIEADEKIKLSKIPVFESFFKYKSERFSKNMSTLKNEYIKYDTDDLTELGEMYKDVINIFENVESNGKIRATSYVDQAEWWTTKFGNKYKEANKLAINRGVEIERIWIFNSKKSFDSTISDMKQQRDSLGVKVYYVFESEIENLEEDNIDILLIKDKNNNTSIYGELELSTRRKMTSAKFGFDIARKKELEDYWNSLINIAKPL